MVLKNPPKSFEIVCAARGFIVYPNSRDQYGSRPPEAYAFDTLEGALKFLRDNFKKAIVEASEALAAPQADPQ